MKRSAVLFSLLAVLLLAFAPGHAASAAPERRFVYLATADTYTFTNVFRHATTPAGEPAPFGNFVVTPLGDRVTIHLDDAATPDGLAIHVRVHQGRGRVFDGCVPVRTTVQIRGLAPGRDLFFAIGELVLDDLYSRQRAGLDCTAVGTGGIATIGGAK